MKKKLEPKQHKAFPGQAGDLNRQKQKAARNEIVGRHGSGGQQTHRGAR
jgi:hypothetical protein